MSTSDCPTCGRPMSPIAVVCPHCSSRRADRDPIDAAEARARAEARAEAQRKKPKPVLTNLSKEETAALLATRGPVRPPDAEAPAGALSRVLLPSPDASGGRKVVEIGLTVLAIPLLLGTVFALSLPRRRHQLARRVTPGRGSHFAAAVLGAIVIYGAGPLLGWSSSTTWTVIVVSGGALLARMAIRFKS